MITRVFEAVWEDGTFIRFRTPTLLEVQQAMQMLGGQSVGFISGEWRDVPRGPVLTMIVAIVLLILAAVIMAYGNSLAH